ncbi:hypothetical protein [Mesorhizobium sp. ES1-1]|uniref:glucosamine inositolphosphorylceramide transferase family protein n=1 Tax=Mesorhizobium sp. ES1-1 TaxID=2876629 RepID=UPI001CCBE3AC|nr:hypothetical protein [Mesorhizobium sp. ES1-1]MBZ9674356.1 hypothetical protein [Mesorhizobium sp. ES1-1]
MGTIDIMVPKNDVRGVHRLVVTRLSEKGHDVALVGVDAPAQPRTLDTILAFERRMLRLPGDDLARRLEGATLRTARPEAELRINMSGAALDVASPALQPGFVGGAGVAWAAQQLMVGRLPNIEVMLDGDKCIARAAPMVDSRVSVARGLNDLLARTVTLLVDTTDKYLKGEKSQRGLPLAGPSKAACPTNGRLIGYYLVSVLPRLLLGAVTRFAFRVSRWSVSYRFRDGDTVAATGILAGKSWRELPDGGDRFYADPFAFEWQGRHFIFVEDFRHKDSKAVISVAEVFREGAPTVPRKVLEEPYHLSYPQVFSHGGEIWMLPEGGSGGNLVLYRAESFPDRWVKHSILIRDRELFDATLLQHAGRFWLFATERDGHGSASDTLVVYHAPFLEGPWAPHMSNPIRIDRAAARPGGSFVSVGDRIVLPLQDGTGGYGSGLGLSDLVQLDEQTVYLTRPVPILSEGKNPYPEIHTLNSNDHLEVCDFIAPLPRLGLRRFG